jgi:hypothetical protein
MARIIDILVVSFLLIERARLSAELISIGFCGGVSRVSANSRISKASANQRCTCPGGISHEKTFVFPLK